MFLAIFLIASLGIKTGRADTVDDLKKSIDQKNEEIRRLEEEAAKYREQALTQSKFGKSLKNEVSRIESTIKQLQKDISVTEQKVKKTKLEIQKTSVEMDQKAASMQRLRGSLGALMQSLAEEDGQSPLKILLQYSSLSVFFNNLSYSQTLQQRTVDTLADLEVLHGELSDKKTEAEDKKKELENNEKQLDGQKRVKEEVKKERQDLLAVTKNQEKKYQQMLKENEKQREEIYKEMESLEETLRKLIDPNSLPKASTGVLLKPVDGVLSQGYGETPFAKNNDFYKFHNGIDLAAPVGTKVLAADSGVVLGTGNTDNYCPRMLQGKYIVVKHNNNLATLYAHLSVISVSRGMTVGRGDIIGYVGNTGRTTGPHLHFTVYDAKTLQIRIGPTGACGLVPIGGSLNPLNYLQL